MPKFAEDTDLQQFNVGNFGFTAQNIEELESDGYTLVDLSIDVSGSTGGFTDMMEKALVGAITSLKGDPTSQPPLKPHPKADSMMIRITVFHDTVDEVIGYTLLNNVDISKLTGCLQSKGMTALFDGTISTTEAASNYGAALKAEDYGVNGILIQITDGLNNAGKYRASFDGSRYHPDQPTYEKHISVVSEAMKKPLRAEAMESYISILIGVNCVQYKPILEEYHKRAGFTQPFISLEDARPETISAIGKFISTSVSSQSTARGTGGPSQSIANTI